MHDATLAALRDVYGGRRWIVAMEALPAAAATVEALAALGATDVLVIAGSEGVGPAPDAPTVVLDVRADSLMNVIRAWARAVADLSDDAMAAIDDFDPDDTATVLPVMGHAGATIGRRPIHGARDPAWTALEDKTTVDALWDAVGVRRAPSVVVRATPEELTEAAAHLDAGNGTVWVADNRHGWHGGGAGLRWVRTAAQAQDAVAAMATLAHHVRVMPFLEGIPCSIHGIVIGDETVALRPCELITLRLPGGAGLRYAGTGTWWDPPDADRAEMRDTARRVGAHLRRTVGYRGAFCIDGVMTADGFLPTELNPRFGAGLGAVEAATGLPLYLLHLAIVADVDVDWRPHALGAWLLERADADRIARSVALVEPHQPDRALALRRDGDDLVAVGQPDGADGPDGRHVPRAGDGVRRGGGCNDRDDDAAGRTTSDGVDVTVSTGPSATGGAVRIVVTGPPSQRGRSVAPTVAAALRIADERWDLGLGPLEPARDVRRSRPARP